MIPATDFFRGPLESALAEDELALEAIFPALPADAGTAFVEIARRTRRLRAVRGRRDRRVGPDGSLLELRCGYLSVAETPIAAGPHRRLARPARHAAAAQARAAVDPQSDLHATADYRRHLAGVLTIRAARQAISAAPRAAAA